LVGDAVVLITTVQEIKTVRGRRWAIVDVGANELVRSVMLGWHHPILGPDGELLATQGPDAIAGPHCFAGDVLLPATDLSGVERGDLLRILHVGAYCRALSNRFNGTPPAGGVVIGGVGL
jgi:diaminopimelate decarboxylase